MNLAVSSIESRLLIERYEKQPAQAYSILQMYDDNLKGHLTLSPSMSDTDPSKPVFGSDCRHPWSQPRRKATHGTDGWA